MLASAVTLGMACAPASCSFFVDTGDLSGAGDSGRFDADTDTLHTNDGLPTDAQPSDAVRLPDADAATDATDGAARDSADDATDAGSEDATADATDGASRDGGTDAADGAIDARPVQKVALVQKVPMDWQYGAVTEQAAFASDVTGGNFIAAIVATQNDNGSTTYSLSDTLANTWKSTGFQRCSSGGGGGRIWYVENAKSGPDTVTVTGNNAGMLGISLVEYSGLATSNTLEVSDSTCAPAQTTSMASPQITTTAQDLLMGVFVDPNGAGVMTAGSGWTTRDFDSGFFYLFEDLQNGSAGVAPGLQQATATNPNSSNTWLAIIAVFKLR